MTTSSDSGPDAAGDPADASPYLPPARTASNPAVEAAPELAPAALTPTAADVAAPFVPAPKRVDAPAPEPVVFDAKQMVESQRRVNSNPAYGALPTATDAGRDAAKKLREKAQRKRARNKRLGWFVGVLFLGGVGAAGWFGYQAYQDEQDQRAIELAEAQSDDESSEAGALTPLGEQVEVLEGMDAVEDVSRPGAGALLDAVDDARAAVGATEGDAGGSAAGVITVADVLPPVVLEIGERLPDATGRDTYIVNADEFAGADPAAFGRFVRLLSTRPQVAPGAAAIEGLPPITPEQIVISVERDADVLRRAIVVGVEVGINVDYRP